jgi:hypothetical protein
MPGAARACGLSAGHQILGWPVPPGRCASVVLPSGLSRGTRGARYPRECASAGLAGRRVIPPGGRRLDGTRCCPRCWAQREPNVRGHWPRPAPRGGRGRRPACPSGHAPRPAAGPGPNSSFRAATAARSEVHRTMWKAANGCEPRLLPKGEVVTGIAALVLDGSLPTNTSLFQNQGQSGFFPRTARHYRLAGGRVEDALRAPLCGRAAPGPGPVRALARDSSGAGKEAGAFAPAGVVGWVAGPGVACPKCRRSGCEPAALAAEWFPGCPPGLFAGSVAARRASAWRQAKMASLVWRSSARRASLPVLPSASFLS